MQSLIAWDWYSLSYSRPTLRSPHLPYTSLRDCSQCLWVAGPSLSKGDSNRAVFALPLDHRVHPLSALSFRSPARWLASQPDPAECRGRNPALQHPLSAADASPGQVNATAFLQHLRGYPGQWGSAGQMHSVNAWLFHKPQGLCIPTEWRRGNLTSSFKEGHSQECLLIHSINLNVQTRDPESKGILLFEKETSWKIKFVW